MSRTIKFDSTESFRVIVTREAIGRIIPQSEKAFGPFAVRGLARLAGERETTDYHGETRKGLSFRIQRTATDWQDVE